MINIAAVQMTSCSDFNENLNKAEHFVQQAADHGATIIGLPEDFAFLGEHEADKLAIQEPIDGALVRRFQELARSLQVSMILGGFAETSPNPNKPYNTSLAIDAKGEITGRYRKIHLFDVDLGSAGTLLESKNTSPGDQAVTGELASLKVGLSICYDLRFSKLYHRLVDDGAQLLSIPAAFTLQTGKDHWEVLMRSRAIEFQSYVMAPAQFGKHNPRRHSFGSAMIVDPWGTVVARCPEVEGVCIAPVDLDRLRDIRQRLPSLKHRRDIPIDMN